MDKKMRLEPLDTMRGFAAIVIACMFHYMWVFGVPGEKHPLYNIPVIWSLTNNGGALVEMFFVISGFLAYMHYHEKIVNGQITFGRFLFGRVSRLYPVMYLSLIMIAVMQWTELALTGTCYFADYVVDVFHFLLNLLGMQWGWFDVRTNFNQPSWYVSVLMMCYVLFFALHRLRLCGEETRGGKLRFAVMVLFGWFLSTSNWQYAVLNMPMGRGIYSFFTGVCLAILLEKDDPRIKKCLKYASATLIGLCLALYVLSKYLAWRFGVERGFLWNVGAPIAFILTPGIICLSTTSKVWSKVLSLKCFTWFGKYSYALYLLNLPIFFLEYYVIKALGLNVNFSSIKTLLVVNLILFVSAVITHHCFEKPVIAWLRRLAAGEDDAKKIQG